ncbi:multi-sensor hybrid histidine kinase [Rhodopirellula maiorica SM1]|uniref:histidine kinase n=1 Tax=Rhodopirellula maiorica SM1 TaxID=1265738 RepID=M5RCQ3_9BACT|nr:hybrid sensor histidine kinase/response regulator [Rhodopirellula maiorica]EMI17263.1 multi-sensor hybrid histidine kinase [Rhodopirellula maiorica SM1]
MVSILNDRRSGTWPGLVRRYGTAILSTGFVIWIRSLLQPWLNEECPFSLFYLSVLLTVWIAGTGPAVFAIGLGTLAAAHFFIPPSSSLLIDDVPDLVQLIIYVFVNCVAIMLFNRAERQRDLAEKRSLENERLSDDLRKADLRKDEFLALLAHELRNPLAPIRTSLALLERNEGSPDVVRRMREIIHRQTIHLIRITDDLLDVSRFCRGKVELQIQRIDLRLAIADAIEMVENAFVSKSQRFQSLIPDDPIWVDGDRVRLAQLLANLLGNASKYTPEAGRITLNLELIDELASIMVSDNGIGFAPLQAERIFEPFVQIDASRTREYGGLGVGLTIANRLVALHGGTLSATSRGPGMGSCFTVTLSAAASEASRSNSRHDDFAAPAWQTPCQSKSSVTTGGKSLLLVEDNKDASELLAELFRAEGFQVNQAYDGVEAIQKATQSHPDVIIMDIGLPSMDGYETARRIRRSRTITGIKMIALTGWGGPTDRDLAIKAGFDLHLIKPIAFQTLLDHVEALVRHASQADSDDKPNLIPA